jgi:hypothetical protein
MVVLANVAFISAARATDQPVVNLKEGQTYLHDYPALGPGNTQDAAGDIDPATCSSTPGNPCDLIPIHIGEPSGSGDFVVTIKVTWDQQPVANGVTTTNQIDVYLWDDPPKKAVRTKSSGVAGAAQVGVDAPKNRKFSLVVWNNQGANNGYHVNMHYFPAQGARPDESLDPTFKAPADTSGSATPTPRSSPRATPSVTGGGSTPVFPSLAPTGGIALGADPFASDPTFANLGAAGFDRSQLTGQARNFAPPAAKVSPPRPVRGLTVALWMTLVPLVLVGLGVAWFARRRPVALRI